MLQFQIYKMHYVASNQKLTHRSIFEILFLAQPLIFCHILFQILWPLWEFVLSKIVHLVGNITVIPISW